MAEVVHKFVCKCGAITLVFDNGATNSMRADTYKKLPAKYHVCDNEPTDKAYCCNHCVNHWGIDIDNEEGIQQELEVIQETYFQLYGEKIPLSRVKYNDDSIKSFKDGSYNKAMGLL